MEVCRDHSPGTPDLRQIQGSEPYHVNTMAALVSPALTAVNSNSPGCLRAAR